jgi:hypothetical protein
MWEGWLNTTYTLDYIKQYCQFYAIVPLPLLQEQPVPMENTMAPDSIWTQQQLREKSLPLTGIELQINSPS